MHATLLICDSASHMHRHSNAHVGKGWTYLLFHVVQVTCVPPPHLWLFNMVILSCTLIQSQPIFLCSLGLQPFSVLFIPCPCCWLHLGPIRMQHSPPHPNQSTGHQHTCSFVAVMFHADLARVCIHCVYVLHRPVCTSINLFCESTASQSSNITNCPYP